jgi:hypothetical protein
MLQTGNSSSLRELRSYYQSDYEVRHTIYGPES